MLKRKLHTNKGQITIDAILSIMFILVVSTIIYYNVFNVVGHFKDAEIADRAYAIADSFENYAMLSYSKNVDIVMELKPLGDKNYTIYFANKKIQVDTKRTIIFVPSSNGVVVEGDCEDSDKALADNVINISFGNFYVIKNTTINIQ